MSGSTSTTTTTSIPNGTSTNVELAEETVNKEAAAVTTSLTTSVASDSTDGTTKEPESSWFGGCCGLKSDKAVDGKKNNTRTREQRSRGSRKIKSDSTVRNENEENVER